MLASMTASERVDERLVASAWERQAFDSAILAPLNLRVVFRGVPSDAGGPDYQDAILVWDGHTEVDGDVEFHVRASDWYRHGHHLDSRYNGVVLHVVWHSDVQSTDRQDGIRVPTVEIQHAVPGFIAASSSVLFPHPCIEAFRALSQDAIVRQIEVAGWERFETRAARFEGELGELPAEQVIYGAVLEALGYASNRSTFRALADAVPIAWLRSIPMEHWAATMLDSAGLGPPAPVRPPAFLLGGSWRLIRIRPSNHPIRRIVAFSELLQRAGDSLEAALEQAALFDLPVPALRRLLMVTKEGSGCLGKGRVDEIVASVVLPFVAASRGDTPELRSLFACYPSPPATRWTRLMLEMTEAAERGFRVRTALHHQGLHHLYHSFCRSGRRLGCPVCKTLSLRQ